ncbi:uncharacterized protein F5Z01DRAFT_3076 [Emericellopsis atlantica]|uniref:Uncharacterized protein n=1 Tax=Emericellopsis atlantica TaxID=2614577 RepID=A0A9P8CU43_9HYPO|nr:uncharacterized protein F5Z01DRAFT_3076 [Emericellopsis atlantica]KAG9258780.1 hypothetical protein F5Z01DRAFT_3076 [Emericellopsis atlantica]
MGMGNAPLMEEKSLCSRRGCGELELRPSVVGQQQLAGQETVDEKFVCDFSSSRFSGIRGQQRHCARDSALAVAPLAVHPRDASIALIRLSPMEARAGWGWTLVPVLHVGREARVALSGMAGSIHRPFETEMEGHGGVEEGSREGNGGEKALMELSKLRGGWMDGKRERVSRSAGWPILRSHAAAPPRTVHSVLLLDPRDKIIGPRDEEIHIGLLLWGGETRFVDVSLLLIAT